MTKLEAALLRMVAIERQLAGLGQKIGRPRQYANGAERQRAYRERNAEAQARWRQNHPEEHAAQQAAYRERKRGEV